VGHQEYFKAGQYDGPELRYIAVVKQGISRTFGRLSENPPSPH